MDKYWAETRPGASGEGGGRYERTPNWSTHPEAQNDALPNPHPPPSASPWNCPRATSPLRLATRTWETSQQSADQAVHEAARAGLPNKLAEMLAGDPSLIDAKGMDGRTPLHCAGTVAVAALLLDHGARIDAREQPWLHAAAQCCVGGFG